MLLKLTLVPVREDRERFAALVSYEDRDGATVPARQANLIGSNPAAVGLLRAVRRERRWVTDPSGKRRWQVVRVSELHRVPGVRNGAREWPRKIDREYERPEEMRRDAIRAVRRAIHVDPTKAEADPDWDLALQLRLDAEARARAAGTPSTEAVA